MPIAADDLTRKFLPPPIGGLNLRDSLTAMPEIDARQLDNVFPDTDSCRIKGGVTLLSNLSSNPVPTLAAFKTSAGVPWLIASFDAPTGDIQKIDPSSGTASSIKGGATISEDIWQTEIFNGRIFFFNGTDAPLDWTGTGNVSATAWTGSGLTITNLIQATGYKGRLYIVEKNTTNIWYGSLEGVTGALTKRNVAPFLRRGGSVSYVGTSSFKGGSLDDEVFVVVSTEGEVLIYAGDYPDSPTWRIVNRYYVPRTPIRNRGYFYVGKELNLITVEGPLPLSFITAETELDNPFLVPAGKVRKLFINASVSGIGIWQGLHFPDKNYILISIPTESYSTIVQVVMNTITKAWCRFTGWEAYSWAYLDGVLYFASDVGKVFEADVQYALDPASTTTYDIRQAYNNLGDDDSDKILSLCEPILTAAKSTANDATTTYDLKFDADFEDAVSTFTKDLVVGGSSTPILNKRIQNVVAGGQFVGPRLSGSFSTGTDLRYYGMNIYSKVSDL